MADLQKEIWLAQLIEQYYQDMGWMSEMEDMSQFVENNTINLSEAGVLPDVLVNNTVYPVPFAERTDTPNALALDVLDTEGTVIRNARKVELAYDKMSSVLRGHVEALRQMGGKRAAYAISPSANAGLTPVIPTSGGDNGNAFALITEADILALAARFDAIDAPEGSRVLVLHPTHFNELVGNSDTLARQRQYSSPEGVIRRGVFEMFGFSILKFRNGVVYNKNTGAKAAFGAAAAPLTDTIASFAFIRNEVMHAVGSYEMFSRLNDPEEKGDIINFQQRFIAMPKRAKYVAAIYSAAA